MVTQEGIATDPCQRECQGPEHTKSLNAITGPTCDPHQRAQEPFQLRIVPPVLGWAMSLAALGPGLSSAAPDLSTRPVRLMSDLIHLLVLVSGWAAHSRASAPSSTSHCRLLRSLMREIVGLTISHDHVLTPNDKKKLRKFNDHGNTRTAQWIRTSVCRQQGQEQGWGGYSETLNQTLSGWYWGSKLQDKEQPKAL